MKVVEKIACTLDAFQACMREHPVNPYAITYGEVLRQIERDCLPHGSGFDRGTKIDSVKSTPERLVFETSFHHMNEGRFYDGWTEHEVIVTPSFVCHLHIHIRVTGRNRNYIKDYTEDTFGDALDAEYVEPKLDPHVPVTPAQLDDLEAPAEYEGDEGNRVFPG